MLEKPYDPNQGAEFFIFSNIFFQFDWFILMIESQNWMWLKIFELFITKEIFMIEFFTENLNVLFVLYFDEFV